MKDCQRGADCFQPAYLAQHIEEYDPIEHARWEGYNQAFKDITERLRKMYKSVPEETQKLLMEHFWDMIE